MASRVSSSTKTTVAVAAVATTALALSLYAVRAASKPRTKKAVAVSGGSAPVASPSSTSGHEEETDEAVSPTALTSPTASLRFVPSVAKASAAAPAIVGLCSAFPPNTHTQDKYLEAFLRKHPNLSELDEKFARRVWAGTKIETSSSYLTEADLFKKMTREEYVAYIKPALRDLALRSAKGAIEEWGGPVSSITHIVFGTMTGSIHAPSMDCDIAIGLGLPENCKRLNVESMGCITGFRSLGLARDLALASPTNVVLLVVCDIRSALQNQLPTLAKGEAVNKSNVIVSSLFRDSGASAIIATPAARIVSPSASMSDSPAKAPRRVYDVIDHRSVLVKGTAELAHLEEKNDSVIFLYIAKALPDVVAANLRAQLMGMLSPYGLSIDDCSFAVHTGGPRVLNLVAEALGVSPLRMASSWYCMKKWGNLSGSSNLVVLDQWRKLPVDMEREVKEYMVGISMGPGVSVELVLLRAPNAATLSSPLASAASTPRYFAGSPMCVSPSPLPSPAARSSDGAQ